jgi:hypothetical protein
MYLLQTCHRLGKLLLLLLLLLLLPWLCWLATVPASS